MDEDIIDVNEQDFDLSIDKDSSKDTVLENFKKNYMENDDFYYDPSYYQFGNIYKNELNLSKQEIRWLNQLTRPKNSFMSIEGCCKATALQYVKVLKQLSIKLKPKKTTLSKEVDYFKNQLMNAHFEKYYYGQYYYDGILDRMKEEVYSVLFKRVENSVREVYGHKRKLIGKLPYVDEEVLQTFDESLGIMLNDAIEELKSEIKEPDIITQIQLNVLNPTKWKIELEKIILEFKEENLDKFKKAISHLLKANQENSNFKNIYYEASKFISKYDRVLALNYYIQYIYNDITSNKSNKKQLSKTIQKQLFKSKEEEETFKEIIDDVIKTEDLKKNLDKIEEIYTSRRKKITLNHSKIEEVEQKHKKTVELLNEFLEDEKSDENNVNKIKKSNKISKNHKSIFITEIKLNQVQERFIIMIAKNSFKISKKETEKYAIENEMFKNQLIDDINTICEEYLGGEVLIEEEDENYIIEESYYKEIIR